MTFHIKIDIYHEQFNNEWHCDIGIRRGTQFSGRHISSDKLDVILKSLSTIVSQKLKETECKDK